MRDSPIPLVLIAGGLLLALVLAGGIAFFFIYQSRAVAQARAVEMQSAEAASARVEELRAELAAESVESRRAVQPPAAPRDASLVRGELEAALGVGEGRAALRLLAELAMSGDDGVDLWVRLAGMDPAALDRLGLGRIDIAATLAGCPRVMRAVLEDADLDPTLRQLAAQTLEQSGTRVRRQVLDELDFSKEKDKRVVQALVRATDGFEDPAYIDRYVHLVQRTDLYNDSRAEIAFRIAAIPGPESRAALDRLRVDSGGEGLFARMLPVLESIHAPPGTGLLVTNGSKPGVARIGHNDLILEYDGQPLRTRADLTRADAKTKPGQIVSVRVLRGGVEKILKIEVTDTAPGHLHFDVRPVVRR